MLKKANSYHLPCMEKMIMNTCRLILIFILFLPYGFAYSEDDMKYEGGNVQGFEEKGVDTNGGFGYKRDDIQ